MRASSHGRCENQKIDPCPLLPCTEGEGARGQDLRKAMGLGRGAMGLVAWGIGQCHGDRRPQVWAESSVLHTESDVVIRSVSERRSGKTKWHMETSMRIVCILGLRREGPELRDQETEMKLKISKS